MTAPRGEPVTEIQEEQLRTRFRLVDKALAYEPLDLDRTLRGARRRQAKRIGLMTVAVAVAVGLVASVGLIRPGIDLLTPIGGRFGAGGEPGDELSRRTFYSVSVTEDGQPRALASGTRIKVSFTKDKDLEPEEFRIAQETYSDDGDGFMSWHAGCNSHMRRFDATAERIRAGKGVSSTLVLCTGDVGDQERWVSRFLGSGPNWDLDGDHLVLTSGETAIELHQDRLPLTSTEFRERWNANARETRFPELVVPSDERLYQELSRWYLAPGDYEVVVARRGSTNGDDGTLSEVYIDSYVDSPERSIEGDERVRMAAWRVLVRSVSPELDWDGVEALLSELGAAGDDEELRRGVEQTAVRGSVRYGVRAGEGRAILIARPVTAIFVWP